MLRGETAVRGAVIRGRLMMRCTCALLVLYAYRGDQILSIKPRFWCETLINVGQSPKQRSKSFDLECNAYILGPSVRVRLMRTASVVGPIYQFRARRPVPSRWVRAISALSAANFTAPPSIHHAPLTLARSRMWRKVNAGRTFRSLVHPRS